jgi:diguanylate cyclase (GGDEF)-like protein/PAS domain S-box-containing protein
MLVAGADGLILSVNISFTNITGYSSEEVIGMNPRILSSGRHDKEFYVAMWASIHRAGFWEGEIWNKRKNGEVYPEHLCITAVKNQEGLISNYVATLTDITMSHNAAAEIQHLAFYDPLTRLPNRRLLMDRLKVELASSSRTSKYGALLFLDLDNFKTLNDTLGHDIGDLLLQQTARRLESSVREGDTVARFGGDEFVVMLENLSEQPLDAASQTKIVGTKILEAIIQPFELNSYSYSITSSIGATLFIGHKAGVEELFKQADIAMYQSKKDGRNSLRFFDHQMQANINSQVALHKELGIAIDKGQFVLYYQIQVDSSRHALGAEALIRWQHPERGLVSPVKFIPLAEDTGLIVPIGKWVLETACAQLKAWQGNSLTKALTLSVNVSAKQFHQADFVEQVQEAVKIHSVNPHLLKLEPTESILLENIDETIQTMNELKAIGVSFALDDFGTGFSSLQYLKKLPLNQLKIDQSFVRDLVFDSNDQAIVRTIIAMAHSLNLEVIAEGVETEQQQLLLQGNGCNHYQGFLFGKPMPIEEFEASLKFPLSTA